MSKKSKDTIVYVTQSDGLKTAELKRRLIQAEMCNEYLAVRLGILTDRIKDIRLLVDTAYPSYEFIHKELGRILDGASEADS